MIPLFGLEGAVAQILILAGGLPSAVNVYILATKYKRDPELASQIVFASTVLCALTLPIILALIR